MNCPKCNYQTPKQAQLNKHYANTGHHKEAKAVSYVALGKGWKKVKR